MLTKKHFIALADNLRGVELSNDALDAIMSFCRSQNHNFNRERWLGYLRGECGPSGGKIKS